MAGNGRYIFPADYRKKPVIKAWPENATMDPEKIKFWFGNSDLNIAVITGHKSGFFCLDVDGEIGKENLLKLEKLYSPIAQDTACMATTPSGGVHFFFKMPPKADIRNSAGKVALNIDVRGNGGYIIVPPGKTINKNGKLGSYEWLNPKLTLNCSNLPGAPYWLLNLILNGRKPDRSGVGKNELYCNSRTSAYGHKALENECRVIMAAPDGTRNDTLNRCAFGIFRLVAGGEILLNEAEDNLRAAAMACGLPIKEISTTMASAKKKAFNCPRTAPAIPAQTITESNQAKYASFADLKKSDLPEPPLEVFPQIIQQMLQQAARAFKRLPIEVPMVAFIALLAACVGRSRVLVVKDGWEEAENLYLGIVAGSGLGKSPCFKAFLKPLWKHEIKEKTKWDAAMSDYLNDMEERKRIKDPDALGSLPARPVRTQFIVEDITMEAIGNILADNPRGLLWYSDELSTIILNLDRYSNTKGGTKSRLLSTYDSAPWKTSRRDNERDQVIPAATLSIVGTTQPRVLKELFGQSDAVSGFLPRFIFVRARRHEPAYLEDLIFTGDALLGKIADYLLGWQPLYNGKEPVPQKIRLSKQAYECYRNWHNHQLMDKVWQESESTQAIAAKLGTQVLRLALLLHSLNAAIDENNGLTEIPAETMANAITLGDWIIEHQKRIWMALDIEEGPAKTPLDKAIMAAGIALEDHLRANEWRVLNDYFNALVSSKTSDKYDNSAIGRAAAKLGIKNIHTGKYRAKEFSEELLQNFKLGAVLD